MTRVPVDADEPFEAEESPAPEREHKERRRPSQGTSAEVEVEREITKRHLIEAITSIVVVILYMAFTLIREREPGVVVLDDDDGAPEDDWKEA